MIVVALKTKRWRIALALSVGLAGAQFARSQPADLVLRNGKVVTLERSAPEAQALAARGGKIVGIGTNQTVAAFIGPSTRVIDLKGRLAIPGFIEGHGHFTSLGASKMMLDLRNAKSWDQIVAMVAAAAKEAKPGTWILGSGFHQAKWDRPPEPNVRGFPVQDGLSRVSPKQPSVVDARKRPCGFRECGGVARGGCYQSDARSSGRRDFAGSARQSDGAAERAAHRSW